MLNLSDHLERLPHHPEFWLVHNGIVITTAPLHLAIHIYNLKCLRVYYLNGGIFAYVKEVVISHSKLSACWNELSPFHCFEERKREREERLEPWGLVLELIHSKIDNHVSFIYQMVDHRNLIGAYVVIQIFSILVVKYTFLSHCISLVTRVVNHLDIDSLDNSLMFSSVINSATIWFWFNSGACN